MGERLPKGLRQHIRRLKSEGNIEEASQQRRDAVRNIGWRTELQHHLHNEGIEGQLCGIFDTDELKLIVGWRRLRKQYQDGLIDDREFDARRQSVFEGKDDLLDRRKVSLAVKFITEKFGKPSMPERVKYK